VSLFPQQFIDDLKAQSDIATVIGEVVDLRRTGTALKGLCPFHEEKTPSFNVNVGKGIFKCFGCGLGGDVLKFIELHQKLTFPEAVRYLALRSGIQVPESDSTPEQRAAAADRETLVKLHEDATTFYREQLATPAGARARRELESRGLTSDTIERFRYGFAPAAGRETLHDLFAGRKVPVAVQIRSGLVRERDDGRVVDRFRNRLMIPISRDTGAIVAFGGRALESGQVPKYLNSNETAIYSKSRTLYGLDVTKGAIRKHNYCVLVEGYFDLSQVWQAGVEPVVATCGTALTTAQARTLKRFTSKVVINFDPDAAGQSAAARSSELLVSEGFQVNVALLPDGSDPDSFVQRSGAKAYVQQLRSSRPYLDFLLDREAAGLDVNRPESRRRFLDAMLTVAATIPDAAVRDQFADRLAHKARITETVIRDEIRKAAAQRKTVAPAVAVPVKASLKQAELGLLWTLVHRPVEGLAAVAQLDVADLEGLVSAPMLVLAASLHELPPETLPDLLRERLSVGERELLERAAAPDSAPASPTGCVNALRRLRYDRERSAVQDEIDQLQQHPGPDGDQVLTVLWERKKELLRRLEELSA
jgi:DNA primase